MVYENYLDFSNTELINYQLIHYNNEIIISELKEIFKNYEHMNIVGKGDTAKFIDTENTFGINQALIFTNHKYSFMNDFESLFGIEHLIKDINYLFIPFHLCIYAGKKHIKFTEAFDFLKMYNFKGKIFVYELCPLISKTKNEKLEKYKIIQKDTTITCINFLRNFIKFNKKYMFYGCYKTSKYHDDIIKLNYKLNTDNKYCIYINQYIRTTNDAKEHHSVQHRNKILESKNFKYQLN